MLIIDGNNLLWKSFYVSNKSVINVCKIFLTLVSKTRPNFNKYRHFNGIYIVWDAFNSWRFDAYKEYKATRSKDDDSLQAFLEARRYLKETVIPRDTTYKQIMIPGFEADDIIADIVRNQKDGIIFIVSSDKDFLQLIRGDPITMVQRIGQVDDFHIINTKRFIDKHGYHPRLWSHVRAMSGDSSDNIPGVKGVGIKNAERLIIKYGSLPGIFVNGDDGDRYVRLVKANYKKLMEWFRLVDLNENHSGKLINYINNQFKKVVI